MSRRRPMKYDWWFAVVEEVDRQVDAKRIRRDQGRVVISVATFRFMKANNDGSNCYPGARTIVRHMILSTDQVADGDRWLEENGFLRRLPNRKDGLKNYRLVIPDGVPAEPYTTDEDGVPAERRRCTGSAGTNQFTPLDDRDDPPVVVPEDHGPDVPVVPRSGPPDGGPSTGTTTDDDNSTTTPLPADDDDPSTFDGPSCPEGAAPPLSTSSIFAGDPAVELERLGAIAARRVAVS